MPQRRRWQGGEEGQNRAPRTGSGTAASEVLDLAARAGALAYFRIA